MKYVFAAFLAAVGLLFADGYINHDEIQAENTRIQEKLAGRNS